MRLTVRIVAQSNTGMKRGWTFFGARRNTPHCRTRLDSARTPSIDGEGCPHAHPACAASSLLPWTIACVATRCAHTAPMRRESSIPPAVCTAAAQTLPVRRHSTHCGTCQQRTQATRFEKARDRAGAAAQGVGRHARAEPRRVHFQHENIPAPEKNVSSREYNITKG